MYRPPLPHEEDAIQEEMMEEAEMAPEEANQQDDKP